MFCNNSVNNSSSWCVQNLYRRIYLEDNRIGLVFASRSSTFLICLIDQQLPCDEVLSTASIICYVIPWKNSIFDPEKLTRCVFEFANIVLWSTENFEFPSSTGFVSSILAPNWIFCGWIWVFNWISFPISFCLLLINLNKSISFLTIEVFYILGTPSKIFSVECNKFPLTRHLLHPRYILLSMIFVLDIGWVTPQKN